MNNNEEKESSYESSFIILKILKFIFFIFIFITFALFLYLLYLQKKININRYINSNINELNSIILKETGELNKDTSLFILKDKVKLKLIPSPIVFINNLELKNITYNKNKLNSKINSIIINLSLTDLIKRKIVIKKITFNNINVSLTEDETLINSVFIPLIDNYFFKKLDKTNITFILKNSSFIINNKKFSKNFNNINLNIDYKDKSLYIEGNLESNKIPLNINTNFIKKNNAYDIEFNFDSQSYKNNIKFNYNENKEFEGKYNLSAINLQMYIKTFFNQDSFLYKKIIDNNEITLNFDFSYKNKEVLIKNIKSNSNDLKGNGNIEIYIDNQKENNFNFNFETINIDNLIIKSLNGNKILNLEDKIEIFNQNEIKEDIKETTNFILKNKTNFNFTIKKIIYNEKNILDTNLNFTYDKNLSIQNINSKLIGETTLKVENEKINIEGKNLTEFLNFVRNKSQLLIEESKKEENKDNSFNFSGDIKIINNKLFIQNSTFSKNNFTFNNDIEIFFDSGISYIAINSNIKELNFDNFINIRDLSNVSLKTKSLFLNNFTFNNIIKINIETLNLKDKKINNLSFIVKTNQGILNIYDINIDNKFTGNLLLDITKLNPNLQINLNINDLEIQKNLNFNNFIFSLPILDGIEGNILLNFKNINFKDSLINTITFESIINNGNIKITNFNLDGFGGKCKITGYLTLLYNKTLNTKFEGCTANIKDLLHTLSNRNNIEGIIGFSSILYSQGSNVDNFIKNYIFKTQFVGTGVIIHNFGLTTLNTNLFEVNDLKNTDKLYSLNPNNVLYNNEDKTIFENISGTINWNAEKKGNYEMKLSRDLINGNFNGTYNFLENDISIEAIANYIMLSGTLEKIIPLTISTNIIGNLSQNSNLNFSTNFNQVDEYLKNIKNQIEEIKNKQ